MMSWIEQNIASLGSFAILPESSLAPHFWPPANFPAPEPQSLLSVSPSKKMYDALSLVFIRNISIWHIKPSYDAFPYLFLCFLISSLLSF